MQHAVFIVFLITFYIMPRQKDTGWMEWHSIERVSDLSEDEIADLEDESYTSYQGRGWPGPSSFLVYSCKYGSYLAKSVS